MGSVRYALQQVASPLLLAPLALAAFTADITLSGVVVARSGRHGALLVSEGRTRAVVAGDRAFGCDVTLIQPARVELRCGAEARTLTLTAKSPGLSRRLPQEGPAPDPSPADVTITRADLDARLQSEMSRLMSETTLIPVTSRGQVAGFTLTRIPPGTILETLGLKAGDVLVSVNDTPVDSFTTLVGLWPRLQTATGVKAQVVRDGKPLDISVNIR